MWSAMSRKHVLSGHALRFTMQLVQRWKEVKSERLFSVSKGDRRWTILFARSVALMRLQQDRKQVVRARVMWLKWHTNSSTMIKRLSLIFTMLGRSWKTSRNGVPLRLLSLMDDNNQALRRESVRMEGKRQALKQPRMVITQPNVLLV